MHTYIDYNKHMNIPNSAFIYVNIFIIAIFILTCFSALKKGLLLQALSLIYTLLSIFLTWFLSPILANKLPIVKISSKYGNLNLTNIANAIIYFIIIFILLKVLYYIISPLFKSVSKIPLVGSVNKIGGLLLGFIEGIIIFIFLTFLVNTRIFANKNEFINGTLFKYGEEITKDVTKFAVNHIDFNSLKDNIDEIDVDEARDSLTTWLIEQGILDE